MLVDTHAHLDFSDDLDGWLARAKSEGIYKIICVGTSVEASKKCVEIAEQRSSSFTQIYATVGIHAQDGKGDIEKYRSLEECIDELRKIVNRDSISSLRETSSLIAKQVSLQNDKGRNLQNDEGASSQNDSKRVVAVGECGFDIHLKQEKSRSLSESKNEKPETSKEEIKFQKELFEVQIGLAAELGLPLVVHCRHAFAETLDVLRKFSTRSNNNMSGVFHSWTGDWEAAQRVLDLGFYISFSGIVTFKNAPKVAEVASKMPLDKMLLETDSPFLTPEPLRSEYFKLAKVAPPSLKFRRTMKNEPGNVKITASFIASLRGLSLEKIAEITSRNAGQLFGLKV